MAGKAAEQGRSMTRLQASRLIRTRYQSGEISIAALAREFGVPYSTAESWAKGTKAPGRPSTRLGRKIRDAAVALGVKPQTIYMRIRRGWSWAEATMLPRGGEWPAR